MARFEIRPATADAQEESFLCDMLNEAVTWRPDSAQIGRRHILADPQLARYVEGWGRPCDVGLIAEAGGRRIGAAWWRAFTDARHGYGFIATSVPELSLAVVPEMRGLGAGTALLNALVNKARHYRVPALSLSVEADNPARHLYERLGFIWVGCVENAWTMMLDLNCEPEPQ